MTFTTWRRVAVSPRIVATGDWLDGEIYEMECDPPLGRMRRLVFNVPARVRSLLHYPADWWRLDDASLLALFDDHRQPMSPAHRHPPALA